MGNCGSLFHDLELQSHLLDPFRQSTDIIDNSRDVPIGGTDIRKAMASLTDRRLALNLY
jgi:hypothetical protein